MNNEQFPNIKLRIFIVQFVHTSKFRQFNSVSHFIRFHRNQCSYIEYIFMHLSPELLIWLNEKKAAGNTWHQNRHESRNKHFFIIIPNLISFWQCVSKYDWY